MSDDFLPGVWCVLPDAEMLQNSRVLNLLHRRQQKEKRAEEKAVVSYQHQCQQPRSRRERDLHDPKHSMKPGDSQMMLQGLTGEDLQWKIRQQKQKDQLRQWLIQQQSEQTAQRDHQKMEGWSQAALSQNTGGFTGCSLPQRCRITSPLWEGLKQTLFRFYFSFQTSSTTEVE